MEMTDKPKSTVGARDIFRMLFKETRRHRGLFLLLFVGSVGIQLAALATPLYMKQFFNILVAGSRSPAAIHSLLMLVALIGAISAAVRKTSVS